MCYVFLGTSLTSTSPRARESTGERDLKTVIEKMANKSQPEKSQENPVLPAAKRYYRPGGTTGQLPANCRKCSLLEVRQ